ncbi:DUF7007 domain-containing protein [Pelagibacterium halotolerans]|uniref:DUF7007 domain-containing protein n=1 Tax=Pelagibacterium halotolerans (strain DSM 22347 / JCM 15775 / CGMCC 1.7692 / B2) TaxID=1082931 RepID=G4RFT8_PELHB|nr:hypothetical protein [Pelagibacterium halotolerans]AEQ50981.1 hypothetical protein KKY_945 [Pelagibacterium halotolerans B2]QJR19125.1 hypothetical protein HKM20_12160 [Pelagibacterium halotolerans]SEA01673.1 hypothetical protein SAMN05428936_101868 [Pelagibacterium halotolerans]
MDWLDEGNDSPWGNVESVEEIAPGIWWIETDYHGGVSLDEDRLSEVPQLWRDNLFAGDGWFEEDCDWVLAAALFPHAFPELSWAQIAEIFEDSFPEYDLPNPPDGERKQAA